MVRHFNYPAKSSKQKEGGYLVRFVDLPEAITEGDDLDQAKQQAKDCLEEATANRIALCSEIPIASEPKRGYEVVPLTPSMPAKVVHYLAVRERMK